MYFHYHNDNENGRRWSHGRLWLNRSNGHDKFLASVCLEWTIPCGRCGWGVKFGGGDAGRDLQFSAAIPFLLTVYITFENVFRMYMFGTDFDRGHDRSIDFYFHDWALWYHVWVSPMASWSRTYSWCRWWRQGSLHFGDLLGKRVGFKVVVDIKAVQIPMPEGVYNAEATIERWTRGRRFWFKRRTTEVYLDIPKGIPHAGKGENSWDCGDDGLFGIGGSSVEDAIGRAVSSVLESRRRHGHASAEAVRRALA